MQKLCRLLTLFGLVAVFATPVRANTVTGIAVSPDGAGVGAKITATVTGTGDYCGAVHIDWGDGTAITYATEKLPVTQTHVYKGGGTFIVRAQGMGNCSGEAKTSVTVEGPAIAAQLTAVELAPNPAVVQTAVSIALQGSGTCRITLDYGDGHTQQLERGLPATVPYTYSTPGTYTVAATPDGPCGERRTGRIEVLPKATPSQLTTVEISPTGAGPGGRRTITVGGSGQCSYRIEYGDGNSESRTAALPDTVQHYYPTAGRYEVVATAAAPCSGVARSIVTVGKGARGQIAGLEVRPQIVARGDTVAIAVAGTGTCQLTFDFDDGESRTVTAALPHRLSYRYRLTGVYEIVVWADEPCTGVGEAVVRVR